MLKCAYNLLIYVAFKRHSQLGHEIKRDPTPIFKLSLEAVACGDIYLAVISDKAHGEPFLALAAIAALERYSDKARRQFIGYPFWMLANDVDAGNACFLAQLA